MYRTPVKTQIAVLNVVKRYANAGIGLRTTEVETIMREAGIPAFPTSGALGTRIVSNAIADLFEQEEIRFVTETFRSYCWIVPMEWRDSARPGYYHIEKVECSKPFGLFPEPSPKPKGW